MGEAEQTSYVAHLGGLEAFGELMWAEARRRGWLRARDSQVLGDGAPWIWNLAGLHFGESLQLVGWYHAVKHLGWRPGCCMGRGRLRPGAGCAGARTGCIRGRQRP